MGKCILEHYSREVTAREKRARRAPRAAAPGARGVTRRAGACVVGEVVGEGGDGACAMRMCGRRWRGETVLCGVP